MAAAEGLHHRISAAPIRVVRTLDRGLRDPRTHRGLVLSLEDIDQLGAPHLTPVLLGLASVQRSGYRREAALLRLGTLSGRLPLGFALRRLNDPVPVIRHLAAALVPGLLERTSASERVACLPLLEEAGLRHASGAAIAALLPGPDDLPALLAGIQATDGEVQRAALRHSAALLKDTAGIAAPLRAGLAAPEPATRLLAARLIGWRVMTPPQVRAALLPRMLLDASPGIRQQALRWRTRDKEADADLLRAAFDANAGVRHLARRYLRRRGTLPDLRTQALAILATAAPSRDALLGALGVLSELGQEADQAVVRPLLSDPRSRVRREAARTLSFL